MVTHMLSQPYIVEVEASAVKEEPKEVQIAVVINWTPERIVKEIRATFPENPELAVQIARCESGKDTDGDGIKEPQAEIVSHTHDYGVMQINRAVWHDTAMRKGLTEYQTDVKQNLTMARHIYEEAGNRFTPWVCYTKGLY